MSRSACCRRPASRGASCFAALALAFATTVDAQMLAASPAELLEWMDSDRDGRVQLVEYQHYLTRGFRAMDRNGDGILSDDELPAGTRARRTPDLTRHEQNLARAFHALDRNGDGALDAVELAAPPPR